MIEDQTREDVVTLSGVMINETQYRVSIEGMDKTLVVFENASNFNLDTDLIIEIVSV